jgi:hypothetical protein
LLHVPHKDIVFEESDLVFTHEQWLPNCNCAHWFFITATVMKYIIAASQAAHDELTRWNFDQFQFVCIP